LVGSEKGKRKSGKMGIVREFGGREKRRGGSEGKGKERGCLKLKTQN
jgi:hypothetical protein